MSEPERAAELNRLEADYQRGALSADDYQRFRARLLGGATEQVVLPSPADPEPVYAPPVPMAGELATWGRRVAAKLFDFALYFAVGAVIGFVVALASPSTVDEGLPTGVVAALVVAGILYPWLMIGRYGQTLGKMVLGVKVVRADDTARVSYVRALARFGAEVGLGLLSLPILLSYLWPIWDGRRQTLHDKIAGTVVVRV